MILKKIPAEEHPQWRVKVMAGNILVRKRRDWGLRRKWEGNYLAQVCLFSKQKLVFAA
jgi:myosin-1